MAQTENANFSNRVSRMWWGLDVDDWNNVIVGSLAVAAFAAVIVGVATYISFQLQKQESAATAAEFARFRLETGQRIAEADARAAEANEQTQRLRADNLALQKLMQPARLAPLVEFSSPDDPLPPKTQLGEQFDGIKPFAGTLVVIQPVPDFEAQTLAQDIARTAGAFGWKAAIVGERETHVPPSMIGDGVQVTYKPNSLDKAAWALADAFTKAGLTGPSGWALSRIFAQGYPVMPDGSPVPDPLQLGYPKFDKPIDAVIVLVGMKPIPAPIPPK